MLYYLNYNPAENKRYVLAYDEEKHGKAQVVNDHTVFLYYRSIIVDAVYNTEAEALKAWGEWSTKPVVMPDGKETIPAYFFGHENIYNVFIPWTWVQGEKWPGEA
jgi:hypothetical protein